MEYKDIMAEVKALDDKGEGILRFIRFNQEDKDSDITLPGFIGKQEAILISSHNWKSDYPPLGRGESFEADGSANFRFKLNMDDPRAKNWYSWLKMDRQSGRPLQQISYGFSPHADAQERGQKDGKSVRFLKPRPDGSPGAKLHELSFVTVGSGNDQGVLDIKEAEVSSMKESRGVESEHPPVQTTEVPDPGSDMKRLISPHMTATDDRPWNFAIEHRQVKASMSAGYYRNLFAVQDEGKDDRRASYRYLHHRVTADGQAGAASIIACSQILHALHKGLIPPGERQGVYAHMAQHLRDAGLEPPVLGDVDSYVYPYDEEAKLFLWHAEDYLLQTGNIHDLRAKKGQTLKQAQIDHFKAIDEKFQALRLLLSLKELDRPFSELVEHMTVEARGEAVATRMQQVAEKIQQDAKATDRAMTEALIARVLPKLH